MLDLLAFDLDGTLADTETLKAMSYGWAAHRLRPDLDPADVETAYLPYVGRSRREIARGLAEQFGLAEAARAHDARAEPWETFVALRLERYRAMLVDGALVRRHAVEPIVALARRGRTLARSTALVTTTDRRNASLVLDALGLAAAFDVVVTSDDVVHTKPHPEPYRLAVQRLDAAPARTLAIEDSPAGLRGALAAGVLVAAVPSAHTRGAVDAMVATGELSRDAVVTPDALAERVSPARARR